MTVCDLIPSLVGSVTLQQGCAHGKSSSACKTLPAAYKQWQGSLLQCIFPMLPQFWEYFFLQASVTLRLTSLCIIDISNESCIQHKGQLPRVGVYEDLQTLSQVVAQVVFWKRGSLPDTEGPRSLWIFARGGRDSTSKPSCSLPCGRDCWWHAPQM